MTIYEEMNGRFIFRNHTAEKAESTDDEAFTMRSKLCMLVSVANRNCQWNYMHGRDNLCVAQSSHVSNHHKYGNDWYGTHSMPSYLLVDGNAGTHHVEHVRYTPVCEGVFDANTAPQNAESRT
jgi:hypothetical protein